MATKPKTADKPANTIAKTLGLEDGASDAAIVSAIKALTEKAEAKTSDLAEREAKLDKRAAEIDDTEKAIALRERAVTDQEKSLVQDAERAKGELQKSADELHDREKALDGREAAIKQREADLAAGGQPDTNQPDPVGDVEPEEGKTRVEVIGPKKGRWRGGRHFGATPQTLNLTDDEIAAINADPKLTFKEV